MPDLAVSGDHGTPTEGHQNTHTATIPGKRTNLILFILAHTGKAETVAVCDCVEKAVEGGGHWCSAASNGTASQVRASGPQVLLPARAIRPRVPPSFSSRDSGHEGDPFGQQAQVGCGLSARMALEACPADPSPARNRPQAAVGRIVMTVHCKFDGWKDDRDREHCHFCPPAGSQIGFAWPASP